MESTSVSPKSGRRSLRQWLTAGLAACALVVPAATAVYYAREANANRAAAATWRARAERLDGAVAARTRELNTRSAALNRSAAKLDASEDDVARLEDRQDNLASEKADLEDQRGLIGEMAREQRDCSDMLSEVLERFAYEDYAWVDANAATVGDACAAARADFDSFKDRYGT
jgi:septal ring factor EnvC (AmiA/AmiB activator)